MNATSPHIHAHSMSSPLLASALTAVITLAAIQAAANPDAFAIVGAMLGTIIIFLEAREKGRSWLKTGSSVIGSAFCGTVLPGALLWFFVPEFAAKAHWQIWAGAGFLCGLAGWATVLAAIAIYESRRDAILKRAADRYMPRGGRRY